MNQELRTQSPENQRVLELKAEFGLERMGLMSSQLWYDDPRGMVFSFSRYKFVAKTLVGKQNVLELGCGDGFHSRIVQQAVGKLTLTDHDPLFIEDLLARNPPKWRPEAFVHNMLNGPTAKKYDAIYSLDVLEHIDFKDEHQFMTNSVKSLEDDGMMIVGMPSLESQVYASEISKMGHINCKKGEELRACMAQYFKQVLVFSMNDEVVHTGYFPMSHYLMAVGFGKKA